MKKQQLKLIPQGASQPCLPEAATPGHAAQVTNLRECDTALRVVGVPATIAQLPSPDHRLLFMDGTRIITMLGNQLMCGAQLIATIQGDVLGTHRVGEMVVISTTQGVLWLRPNDSGYQLVTLDDACPAITLGALEWDSATAAIGAVTFQAPYSQWPTTLATADLSRLTVQLRHAWSDIQQTVDAAGAYAEVMQLRCGVRLHDDTYLWLSAPVTMGLECLQDAQPVTVETTLDGTAVTGAPSTTLTRHRFRVALAVQRGIAPEWLPLVKAIDILATRCASPVLTQATASYRCIGVGGNVRRPQLEMGLPPVGLGAVMSQLEQSGWHVVASTTDVAALSQHQWQGTNTVTSAQTLTPGLTSYVVTFPASDTDCLTLEQAKQIELACRPLLPVASMCSNARLYCVDASGLLAVSVPGNPLSMLRHRVVTGAEVSAIVPLSRPVYSNGFGRYPIALFTAEGIYAVPQTNAGGSFGEPRLLSRATLAEGCQPIEGDRDIYFCDSHGDLCRLRGSEVQVLWRGVGACRLVWEGQRRELLILAADGALQVMMPSGRTYRRTLAVAQLFSDAVRSLAVDQSGAVLDLSMEQPAEALPIVWHSHPFLAAAPRQVVWQLMGTVDATLQVTGERGVSCHGFDVGSLRVSGEVNAPLRQRLLSPPLRTMRLVITGTANSGTTLLQLTMNYP